MRFSIALLLVASTSAHAAHPLFTDDAGTQEKGNFQLEAIPESARDHFDGVTTTTNVTNFGLAYGVVDTIDVFVGVPYVSVSDGATATSGVGDTQAGIKWRFHEWGAVSFALKPALSFATGDESKGLGTGRNGYSVFASGTYAIGRSALNAQIGYIHAPDVSGSPANSTALSIGGWYEVERAARLVIDYGYITNPDTAVSEDYSFAIAGVIFLVSDDLDIDVGYRKGLTDVETDSTLMLGMTARF